ncbi:hypothetical protein C0Q70_15577 [Pomacea canaliculata]|uniref:Uncharacterized protein n=1 Tax=Pomacea canaliculata TaxID=400727 RepID=A0A2T7NV78_POMCA|nr:hypothetical protein C0Q70_15577 [Pomacea canaliculata]
MTGPWPPCSPLPPPACWRPTSTVLSLLQGETMVMEDDQRRCDSADTGCELRDCIGLIPIKKKRTTRGVKKRGTSGGKQSSPTNLFPVSNGLNGWMCTREKLSAGGGPEARGADIGLSSQGQVTLTP